MRPHGKVLNEVLNGTEQAKRPPTANVPNEAGGSFTAMR